MWWIGVFGSWKTDETRLDVTVRRRYCNKSVPASEQRFNTGFVYEMRQYDGRASTDTYSCALYRIEDGKL